MNQLSYYLMHNLNLFCLSKQRLDKPEDEQLCKLSATYKEIKCIQNHRHLKK